MITLPESIRQKIDAAIHGDATSLGVVFEWFRPRLRAHAMRICGNTPAAQDAVQDTFISAFTHLHSLREATSFYPWLKRILVNHCYQMLRRENSVGLEKLQRNDALLEESIDAKFESMSNRQRIYHSLRHLSGELRSCVLLRYFSEFNSYSAISVLLGIPIGTVRSRLAAAREQLALMFRQEEDAGDEAMKEATQWSKYYKDQWDHLYDDLRWRNEMFNHLHPKLEIHFTSGKMGQGRAMIESEISNDLEFGSRFNAVNVVSSGHISLVEGPNINHPDMPDRCAPASAYLIIRNGDTATTLHLFDSPRI